MKYPSTSFVIVVIFTVSALSASFITCRRWHNSVSGTETVDSILQSYIETDHSQLSPINQDSMKQCTLQFPENKSAEVSKFFAENGIVTNLSYMKSDGFFSNQVVAVICFPSELEDKVKANLNTYIKK